MTRADLPDPPAATGEYIVRDPAVRAELARLLAPHRAGQLQPSRPASAPSTSAEARAHAAVLTARDPESLDPSASVTKLLDHVHTVTYADALNRGREQATSEGREWTEQLQERARRAETAAAHAERDLDKTRQQLADALAKITELEARPSGRRPTVSAQRLKDQQAFASLADRMDREAMSQTKTAAAILRLASKSVREEIAIVYGNAERKAS